MKKGLEKINKTEIMLPQAKCQKCGMSTQSKFYLTKDPNRCTYGKILYCKDCVRKIYEHYYKKYKNINLGVYYTCRKIDIPYIDVAFKGAMDTIKNPKSTIVGEENIIPAYFKGLAVSEQNGWGYTFDDSIGEDKIDGIISFDIYTKVKRNNRIVGSLDDTKYDIIEYETEALQMKWGDYDNADLGSLETEYLDWQDKLGGQIDDKTIDELIKQICYQTLEIKKDRENGDDCSKKVDTLIKLMNNSNLIEKQKKTEETVRTAGQRIEDIERTRPIKKVDSELSDVDNIERLLIGYIGTTARALGKENYYTKKFDELYKSYSIDIIENNKNKDIISLLDEVENNNG